MGDASSLWCSFCIFLSHPGLPTEWTHFPLWLQLLPVAIGSQISSLPAQVPGLTCLSNTLTRRHNWRFKFEMSRTELTIFISKPAPLRPMLFLPSNEWRSAGPQAESFLSPTSRDHHVLSILLLPFILMASTLVPALLTPCPRLLSQSFNLEAHPDWALTMPGTLLWLKVAYSFSRGSSQPRNWTRVSFNAADSLPAELSGKPSVAINKIKKKN